MKKQAQKGFTLVELMIVIAIVGILAAVALPAYQDYTIRAKMSEPLALMGEAKTTIAEYYIANGVMPSNASQAGVRTAINTDIVKSLSFASNLITIQVQDIGGDTGTNNLFVFSLTNTTSGSPQWKCKPAASTPINISYMPANCRG